MNGKTHMTVGMASSIAILQPNSLPELVLGAGLAGVGALISDIDVDSSTSHKSANKILSLCAVAIVGILALQYYGYEMKFIKGMLSEEHILRCLGAFAVSMILCAYGKEQPHRGAMHSIAALAVFGICVKEMFPAFYMYFGVGFASHLILDIFNKKGMQLLFPYKKRFCLRWIDAGGTIDKMIGKVASLALIVLVVGSAAMITKSKIF